MTVPRELKNLTQDFMTERLSLTDMMVLVRALDNIDWGEIEGGGNVLLRSSNLIDYMERRDRFVELLSRLAEQRKDPFKNTPALVKEAHEYGLKLGQDGLWDQADALLVEVLCRIRALTPEIRTGYEERWKTYWEGRAAADQKRWDEAREAFAEVAREHPGYRDAERRLKELKNWEKLYQEGRKLWEAGQWDESAESFGDLASRCGEYKDVSKRLEDLTACQGLAEKGEKLLADWEELAASRGWGKAEEAYRTIEELVPGYRDASSRLRLVQSLKAVNERRWEEAEHELEKVAKRCPAWSDAQRLLAAVRRLRRVKARLASGVVYDPGIRWSEGFPYDLLEVSPTSSMEQIRDASLALQQKGKLTPERRAAWDTLRNPERRLHTDAYLLLAPPDEGPKVLAVLEGTLASRFRLLALGDLEEPLQTVPVLLLLGARPKAVELLEGQQAATPDVASLSHQLGLLYLGWAEEGEEAEAPDDGKWLMAIGQWVVALTAADYWRDWIEERGRAYGRAVSASESEKLRSKLEEDLARRVNDSLDRRQDGDDRLRLSMLAEFAAVRLLERLGRLPVPERGRIVCGPHMLGPLGLTDALAGFVAGLTEEPKGIAEVLIGAPSEADVRELRQLYSSLALPTVLLDSRAPDRALKLLQTADCGSCRPCGDPTCSIHSGLTPEIRICCDRCPSFKERNPGYARLEGGAEWLREDALRLATRAHLLLAEKQEGGLPAVRAEWQRALDLARYWEGDVEIRDSIRATATALATDHRKEADKLDDEELYGRAIGLLEIASELVGSDSALNRELAEALTNRGIDRANGERIDEAVADLERAFALLPTNHRVRDQYATALAGQATGMEREEALEAFARARKIVEEGQRIRDDYLPYQQTLQMIEQGQALLAGHNLAEDPWKELEEALGPETGEGETLQAATVQRRAGNLEAALEALVEALEREPGRKGYEDEILEVLHEQAEKCLGGDSLQDYDAFVEAWKERLASHGDLVRRIESQRWDSLVRHFMKKTELKHFYGAGDTILVPFESTNLGMVMVRLSTEGEMARLTSALTAVPEPELAVVLENLLQALCDIMFVKLVAGDSEGLAMECRAPIRHLKVARIEYLIRCLARYADLSPTQLRNTAELRAYLQLHRELLRLALPETKPSLESLEELCAAHECQAQLLSAKRGEITTDGRRIELHAIEEGIRFVEKLGRFRPAKDREQALREMARWNGRLGLGKLGLDEHGEVRLQCEFLNLDEDVLATALELGKRHGAQLAKTFTRSA